MRLAAAIYKCGTLNDNDVGSFERVRTWNRFKFFVNAKELKMKQKLEFQAHFYPQFLVFQSYLKIGKK